MNLVSSEHGHNESYLTHWISIPTSKEEQARVMPLSISFGDETRWRHRVAVWCRDGVYHLMATQSESGLDRQKPEERMHTEGAAEIPVQTVRPAYRYDPNPSVRKHTMACKCLCQTRKKSCETAWTASMPGDRVENSSLQTKEGLIHLRDIGPLGCAYLYPYPSHQKRGLLRKRTQPSGIHSGERIQETCDYE